MSSLDHLVYNVSREVDSHTEEVFTISVKPHNSKIKTVFQVYVYKP